MTLTATERSESVRLLAASLVLAAAVLAPAAAAAPPDIRIHEDVDRTRTLGVCGFPITSHSEGVFTTWQYLDDAGNVVRERLHVEQSFTVTLTNPANGKSISSVLGGPVVNDFLPDGTQIQTVAGRERLFIARGEGPVAMQVGRIVFVVDPAGNETIPFATPHWDVDIFPELCAYLA
jgi:hypothetical protein